MNRFAALFSCLLAGLLPCVAAADARDDANAAVAAAEAAVRARLDGGLADAQVVVTGRPRSLALPEGLRQYSARPIDGEWPRRRFSVQVDVAVDGRTLRTVPVAFELRQPGQALAYVADLRSHAAADRVVLEAKQADLARVHGSPVTAAAILAGLRLRHAVRGGDVAVIEDFEPIPDIDIHQRVRVLAAQGAIHLESGGLALRSGNRGDRVTVQIDGGERPVDAMVIDKGVAEVVP